ncbi:50S ribosomal protein L19e [Candidatus Woesearchaeota archaeon]|nr:50S ribosomal protein L19e [Candidatus Woesearchaeota archaeon]
MKQLKIQKRLAATHFKGSKKRVRFDPDRLEDVKEAITKYDVKALIKDGAITEVKKKGVSRGRARKRQEQKRKGRQKGQGLRKGKKTARLPKKQAWMQKIRVIRKFLKELKEKDLLTKQVFRDLYRKAKGGFFRSKRHVKIYITEKKLVNKDGNR